MNTLAANPVLSRRECTDNGYSVAICLRINKMPTEQFVRNTPYSRQVDCCLRHLILTDGIPTLNSHSGSTRNARNKLIIDPTDQAGIKLPMAGAAGKDGRLEPEKVDTRKNTRITVMPDSTPYSVVNQLKFKGHILEAELVQVVAQLTHARRSILVGASWPS